MSTILALVTGCFQFLSTMRLDQSNNAQASTEAVFGVSFGLEDQIDEGGGVWADPLSLALYLSGAPPGIAALAIVLGPMADLMARLAGICSATVVCPRLPDVRT